MDSQTFLKPEEKYIYAKIKYFRQKYIEASRIFDDLEDVDMEYFDKTAEFYFYYGKTLIKNGQGQRGEAKLKKALSLYPNYIPGLMELSLYEFSGKRYKQAMAYLNKF